MSVWTAMQKQDFNQVMALAQAVHPSLPESLATQEQRLKLFPSGCLVLKEGADVQGYSFAHPIRHSSPPALDTAPQRISLDADELYLHDFVVSPSMRGRGYARDGVNRVLQLGQRFSSIALISVYGTAEFWGTFGFSPSAAVPAQALVSYGPGAVYMVKHNVRVATDATSSSRK